MSEPIKGNTIAQFHQECIINWKTVPEIELKQQHFLALVEENHYFNYQLWHAEDRARREDKGAEFVYLAKREIDHCNQQRNNRMEAMDEWLFNALKPIEGEHCPVHSETPGMIIDRLSILALKAYHMAAQTKRSEVGELHRQSCLLKLQTILAQQNQLVNCFNHLLQEVVAKTRTFRVYHQFKMYNDPSLNPQMYLYSSEGSGREAIVE